MCVGLSDQVAKSICSPALSEMAGVSVDFLAMLAKQDRATQRVVKLHIQLITILASGEEVRSLNAFEASNPSSDGAPVADSRNRFSLRAYTSKGKMCHAYSVSPSGVLILKGVT